MKEDRSKYVYIIYQYIDKYIDVLIHYTMIY